MKLRILSFFLAAAMLLAVIPSAAAAEDDELAPDTVSGGALSPVAAADHPVITGFYPFSGGVLIQWDAYNGADKYVVSIKDPSGKWKLLGGTSSPAILHRFTPDGTAYTYTVRALDKNGAYLGGYDAAGTTYACYPAPKLQTLTNMVSGQKLTWSAVPGVSHYRVCQLDGSARKVIAVTGNTSYIDTGAVSGKARTYTVCAYDKTHRREISYYDTTGLSGVYYAAPRITGFQTVSGGLRVSWDPVAGASRYSLLVKIDGHWIKKGYTSAASVTHTDLTYNTLYTYSVCCVDKNGNRLSAYDANGKNCLYSAPPAIKTVQKIKKGIGLTWTPMKRFRAYQVYRRAFGKGWQLIGKTAGSYFIDTTADSKTAYTYTLRGVVKVGNVLTGYRRSAVFYRDGSPLNGTVKISGVDFTFAAGKLTTGFYAVNKTLRYYDPYGILQKDAIVGSKKEGYTYADKNGVCITTKQVRLAAKFIAEHGKGKTLSERAGSAIIYMKRYYPYRRSYNHPKKKTDLPALATDMFTKHSGNCFRYATSFAYMIKIAGYRVKLTVGTTAGSPHGWLHVKVGSRWIMCDNRIVGMPDYYFPDFTGYTYKLKGWRLKGKFTTELVFTENGKAVWQ